MRTSSKRRKVEAGGEIQGSESPPVLTGVRLGFSGSGRGASLGRPRAPLPDLSQGNPGSRSGAKTELEGSEEILGMRGSAPGASGFVTLGCVGSGCEGWMASSYVTVTVPDTVTDTLNVLAEYENEKLVSVKCSGVKLRGGIRGE